MWEDTIVKEVRDAGAKIAIDIANVIVIIIIKATRYIATSELVPISPTIAFAICCSNANIIDRFIANNAGKSA